MDTLSSRHPPTASRIGSLMPADRMDALVSLAKRRGFAYPGSEIYGGLRASWDYGPLGVELKNNIKRHWWRTMVQLRDDIVGLDSCIILAPRCGRRPATSAASPTRSPSA